MEKIIEVNSVSKTFKHKKAVNNVSFHVNKGEIVALLGPNGAGKTTTMSMMLGLKDPTEGTVSIFGKNPKHRDVRNSLGAMLQEVSVIDSITNERKTRDLSRFNVRLMAGAKSVVRSRKRSIATCERRKDGK
ncbi:ABC transporter, ATP-binding protein [Bacillus cereus 95/8201]|uniref:ABC transporter family protein n=1 Tax=Bacillus thuringiensis TaxID=1428 RepID=A0AB33AWB5_BACTU|nr:ABC transporter family protein [Bacillus thuringiensis]AJH65605.1 ABC transporter family protein [Bacillus cereus]EEL14308.1 ABC transporter, ATP-binding protein [Bacillus cereus 95/8201]EEM74979.1 ABC transporter, ATP-binding protein [Bacillus thuringiensis serovar pondicheriensis BGSC 4BA1]AJK36440.1 ABC transporter family protein [Bacillus cereus]